MVQSQPDHAVHRGQPFVRRRWVRSLAPASLWGVVVLFLAALPPSGLGWFLASSVFTGSLPIGLVSGFLAARRVAKRSDASGVYRHRAPSMVVVVVMCAAASIFVGLALLLFLSQPQLVAITWGISLVIWGLAAASPLGILLFERRARSRLWVLWFPSPWSPAWIEYRVEYHPPKGIALPAAS